MEARVRPIDETLPHEQQVALIADAIHLMNHEVSADDSSDGTDPPPADDLSVRLERSLALIRDGHSLSELSDLSDSSTESGGETIDERDARGAYRQDEETGRGTWTEADELEGLKRRLAYLQRRYVERSNALVVAVNGGTVATRAIETYGIGDGATVEDIIVAAGLLQKAGHVVALQLGRDEMALCRLDDNLATSIKLVIVEG